MNTLPRKLLPIGIQTFRKIREKDFYYVDKTSLVMDLIEQGSCYFLSRPRRFGKSLLIDTLKELFEGSKDLFTGLAAETRWDWGTKFPVIRISFGAGVVNSRAKLDDSIECQLLKHEVVAVLQQQSLSLNRRFSNLIAHLHAQTGQRVVVLVDEYDKPLLDRIEQTELAMDIREGLKDIYSVIKDSDAHIRFAMLTGVSKFSKVSLFSGLNNLTDITLDAAFSDICGYTDHDVDTVFAAELPGLDREQIRQWYNGNNWLGTPVYNPFDLLLLFRSREFRPYWFETGTPTFLVKLITERQFYTPDLGRIVAPEALLSTFDVDNIPVEALLFQTGYLTVDSVWGIPGRLELTLKYPNLEVQAALNDCLLQALCGNQALAGVSVGKLYRLLQVNDFAGLQSLLTAFYASIAHQWYRQNKITQYEGFYASVFYSSFAALGLDISPEESTSQGCLDMAVRFNGNVYLFEFKVVAKKAEGRALQQIKDKAYADKYKALGQPIHLIGVEFSKASRTIVRFDVETLQNL